MIHARKDYNRFQDPALVDSKLLGKGSNPISEDEPVMLFRARDKFFVSVIDFYRALNENEGSLDMVKVINDHIKLSKVWQEKNGIKTPDL